MKTIARTLIILFAAGLIALGWTTYASTDSAQSSQPERPAEFTSSDEAAASQLATDEVGQTSSTEAENHEHAEQSFSAGRVLSGMVVTIGQTALVIGLVFLFRKLTNRFTSSPGKLAWYQK